MSLSIFEPSIEYYPPNTIHKYGYFLYIPDKLQKGQLILWLHGSIKEADNYGDLVPATIGNIRNIVSYCDNLGLIAIMPILPRSSSRSFPDCKLDSQSMTAEVMLNESSLGQNFYKRPDLEIINIINHVKDHVLSKGVTVEAKIIIGGISAGGSFANRFSILHPWLIDIEIPVIAGDYMYPEKSINGLKLNYPYGIDNLGNIANNEFSYNQFSKIKHVIYTGKNDIDPKFDALSYELNGDERKIENYRKVVGKNAVERSLLYSDYLKQHGITVHLDLGADKGHELDGDVLDSVFGIVENLRRLD